jgi:hypothetical protein
VREQPQAALDLVAKGVAVYRRHLWDQEKGRLLESVLAATHPG